ncbi:MAG TPA: hypothetical protein VLX90_09570 [Steroidobacteraceae bacterium]|nr:hypothetical protein [Steroidobacteraceae bacterium]
MLSAGGVGVVWSGELGIVLGDDDSLGADGDVAVESLLGVDEGDIDCCFEQAASARALRHNNKILRFMGHLVISGPPGRQIAAALG